MGDLSRDINYMYSCYDQQINRYTAMLKIVHTIDDVISYELRLDKQTKTAKSIPCLKNIISISDCV